MSEYDVNDEFSAVRSQGGTYVSRLSERGVFVHTDARPEIGSLIDLRFTVIVDDPVIIEARGRVDGYSDHPKGLRVEFVELQPQMHLRLLDAVSRTRASMPGEDMLMESRPATMELDDIDIEDAG